MSLYSGGLIFGRIFAFEILGDYFWEDVFLDGPIKSHISTTRNLKMMAQFCYSRQTSIKCC